MAYKVCSSCGKHVRDSESRCWSCQSVEFIASAVPEPAPLGIIGKVKQHVAAAQQKVADERRRQQQDEVERQKLFTIERAAAFEKARRTCPFPLTSAKVPIAGGLDLLNDEFVVSVAKEWGLSTQKLTLTTHRVIWSRGVVSTNQMSLYLTDIRDVKYHSPLIGFSKIVLETAAGRSVEGLPAAANGNLVRDQLMKMIHWARQRVHQPEAPAPAPSVVASQAPDRLDQLRRLGDLKAQGVLSDEEFQAEKAKLLSQTS